MKTSFKFLLIAASLGIMTPHASAGDSVDCVRVANSVRDMVSRDRSEVLTIVSNAVAGNPACACEIVKTAIVSSRANSQSVGAIVSAAGNAAPDQLDLIVQCATAAAPDASPDIRAAAAGVQASMGVAGGFGETGRNPLDFPGDARGAVRGGGAAGGVGGGGILLGAGSGVVVTPEGPPPIIPPFVTPVNP